MPFVFVLPFFQTTLFWNPSILLCDVVISKWWKCIIPLGGFPGGSVVKNPPAKQEMWVPPLGGGNPQEKDMAADSSILAWEIPWTEEPGSPWGHKRVGHNLAIKYTHIILFSFPPLSGHCVIREAPDLAATHLVYTGCACTRGWIPGIYGKDLFSFTMWCQIVKAFFIPTGN